MGSTNDPKADPTAITDPKHRMDVDDDTETKNEPSTRAVTVTAKEGGKPYRLCPMFKVAIETCEIKSAKFLVVRSHAKNQVTVFDGAHALFVYVSKAAMKSFAPMANKPKKVFGITNVGLGLVTGMEDSIVALLLSFDKSFEVVSESVKPLRKSFAARFLRVRFFTFATKSLFLQWADGDIAIAAAYDGLGTGVEFKNAMVVYREHKPIPSNYGVFAHLQVLGEFVGTAHPNGKNYVDLALSLWGQYGKNRDTEKELAKRNEKCAEEEAQQKLDVAIARRIMAKASLGFRDQKNVSQLKYGTPKKPTVTVKESMSNLIDEYSPLHTQIREAKLCALYFLKRLVPPKRRTVTIGNGQSEKYDFSAFAPKDESKSDTLQSLNGVLGLLVPRDMTLADATKNGGYRDLAEWDTKCREMVPVGSKVGTLETGEYVAYHHLGFYEFAQSLGGNATFIINLLTVDWHGSQLQRHRSVVLVDGILKETNDESILTAPKTFINSRWSMGQFECYQIPLAQFGDQNGVVLRYDLNSPLVYASCPLVACALFIAMTTAIGSVLTTCVRVQPNMRNMRWNKNRTWDMEFPFDVDSSEVVVIIHNGECHSSAVNQRNYGDYGDFANVAKDSAKDVLYGQKGKPTAGIFTLQTCPDSQFIVKFGGTTRDFRACVFYCARPLVNQMNANAAFFERNRRGRGGNGNFAL